MQNVNDEWAGSEIGLKFFDASLYYMKINDESGAHITKVKWSGKMAFQKSADEFIKMKRRLVTHFLMAVMAMVKI